MNAENLKQLWHKALSLSVTTGYSAEPLPWDWHCKTVDFIKPGDEVLNLDDGGDTLAAVPDDSVNVLLSRENFHSYQQAHRVLKKNGFFLCELTGSDHCRALAEYLTPNSRPAAPLNLENELPEMQAAGFRIMFRSQAYPIGKFTDFKSLLWYIAQNPSAFPGFSVEAAAPSLQRLREDLTRRGFIPNREHRFILIGKKR